MKVLGPSRSDQDAQRLDESEQRRLDKLFERARAFHVGALALTGISIVLAVSRGEGRATIPVAAISVSYHAAVILAYLLCILFTSMSIMYLRMAIRFLALDPRRPPFAWAPFVIQPPSRSFMFVWVLAPVLVSCFATYAASSMVSDAPAWQALKPLTLIFLAMFVFDLPVGFALDVEQLRERRDREGRALTLSIFLHFLMRRIRGLGLSSAAVLVILGLAPGLDRLMLRWAATSLGVAIAVSGLCYAAVPFHERIDRHGSRHGFAEWYEPRDGPRDSKERVKRPHPLRGLFNVLQVALGVLMALTAVALIWGKLEFAGMRPGIAAKPTAAGSPGDSLGRASPKQIESRSDSASGSEAKPKAAEMMSDSTAGSTQSAQGRP